MTIGPAWILLRYIKRIRSPTRTLNVLSVTAAKESSTLIQISSARKIFELNAAGYHSNVLDGQI
jgi:hypothetical protein